MFLYPYGKGSSSANDLSKALGAKQIKLTNSKFKGSADKVVINWGRIAFEDEVFKCNILNKPEAVAVVSNKLTFFNMVQDYNFVSEKPIPIPNHFTSMEHAARYVQKTGGPVLARTILNGHSGEGIVICESVNEVFDTPAKLYTIYIPKTQEYRIHVFRGEVVDVQRKARRRDVPDDQVNWKIRNHDNGFIYSREMEVGEILKDALDDCIKVVDLCGLDFGAVDVIFNKKKNKNYILEVNTAPGLSGTTLDGYVRRFQEYAKQHAQGGV